MPKKVTAKPQKDGSVLIEELVWKTREGAYRARRRGRGGAMKTFAALKQARAHRDSQAESADQVPTDSTLTLAKVQREYFELRQDWSAATRKQTDSNWRKLKTRFGGLHPNAITTAHVLSLRNALKNDGLSDGSQKNILTLLGQLLTFAQLQGYRTNAIQPVRAAKVVQPQPTTGEGRKRAMPAEVVDAYLAELSDAAALAALIAYHCGPRTSEVLRLQVRHVDFLRGTMDVPGTKTRASVRTVPVPQLVLDAIAASLPKAASPGTFLIRTTHSTNRGGLAMHRKTLENHWNRARTALDDWHRFYDLRHSFCTDQLDAGVPPQTVAALAGHERPSITLDVYAHSTPTGLALAKAAMDAKAAAAQSRTIPAQSKGTKAV